MNILFLVQYLANNRIPAFSKSKGGFGYMVYDIARSETKINDVESFVLNYHYKGLISDGIVFLPNTIAKKLRYLFQCVSIEEVIKLYRHYKMSKKELLVLLYHWIQTGYIKHIIKKGNYDIVHIHGCYFGNTLLKKMFAQTNQKFVLTLHGLNSISESVHIEEACKQYERDLLQQVCEERIPMTVISSGIKKTILKTCGYVERDNIRVVTNGSTMAKGTTKDVNIRALYKIPPTAKVILYVGNITYNKNQQQMVESFDMMPETICDNTFILFLGRNIEPGYDIKPLLDKSKYKNHLILCGNIDKEVITAYYQQADGVVLLSFEEGFGLSLIEGMQFGLPCMAHQDIYAFDDIYDSKAMIGIKDRSNESVAQALVELIRTNWDKEEIIKYSENFSMSAMAKKYNDFYKEIVYGR